MPDEDSFARCVRKNVKNVYQKELKALQTKYKFHSNIRSIIHASLCLEMSYSCTNKHNFLKKVKSVNARGLF